MANFTLDHTNMVLNYYVVDVEKGKEIDKRLTLSRVNSNLTADQMSEVAIKLFALSKHTLMGVDRVVRESIHY